MLNGIRNTVPGELAFDLITGAAHSCAVRAAALDHKPRNDSMKYESVIETLLNQIYIVFYADRGNVFIKFGTDNAALFHFNCYYWMCHIRFCSLFFQKLFLKARLLPPFYCLSSYYTTFRHIQPFSC